jgi:NAD(P)-dependent dehydrogenase (short-subunit alcohol dehydrogenase family)
MTVISKESNDGSQSAYRDFRDNWAIPFGRPGSAADHAQIILSVATNQYMTGAEIVVDGGWLLESGKCQDPTLWRGRVPG